MNAITERRPRRAACASTIAALRPSRAMQTLADYTRAVVASGLPDLSARQVSVLLHASRNAGCSVREFAAEMRISKPATTRALDRLTELDLVRRGADPNDLRLVSVRLTQVGVAHAAELERLFEQAMATVLEGRQE